MMMKNLMPKKTRNVRNHKKITYDNIVFDSQPELDFYHWLVEAKNNDLVCDIEHHPQPFILSDRKTMTYSKQLKTKIAIEEKTLFQPCTYTPDFVFKLTNKGEWVLKNVFEYRISDWPYKIYVDVKGGFEYSNDFGIKQKWIYDKFGLYINKIIPHDNKKNCLFKKTFVPKNCLYTYTGKQKQINYKVREVKEIMKCFELDCLKRVNGLLLCEKGLIEYEKCPKNKDSKEKQTTLFNDLK